MIPRITTHAPIYMLCACGKAYSPSRSAAKQLRREIEAYKGRQDVCRYYECESGGWHWTRMVDRATV
jgi:hypothetical protein